MVYFNFNNGLTFLALHNLQWFWLNHAFDRAVARGEPGTIRGLRWGSGLDREHLASTNLRLAY